MLDIINGDALETLRLLPDASVDAVLCDPPYGLSHEPDALEVLRHWLAGDDYQHGGRGFMGKSWDSFVPGPSVWREVLRVLKPGGHALVFSGTRTYDLLVLACRIAGFQVRDQLVWLTGQGFPKSKNVALAIDNPPPRGARFSVAGLVEGERFDGTAGSHAGYVSPEGSPGEPWNGWGTALKPALEPIALLRKPLIGTVAANVLQYGTGGINVDGCRIGDTGGTRAIGPAPDNNTVYGRGMGGQPFEPAGGRWPANVLADEDAYPPEAVDDIGDRYFYCAKASRSEREAGLAHLPLLSGGQATGRKDGSDGLKSPRAGAGRGGGRHNPHPTVKPIELLRYLARLITPPGGTVLVPFAGSGSEVIACGLEGFHALGIEQSEEYTALGWARVGHHCERPELSERARGWYDRAC